jgi:hypothetical protein
MKLARPFELGAVGKMSRQRNYSTVTDLAKFLGLSTSVPRAQAV